MQEKEISLYKDQKGFTLVEMIVVVVIIAILAAIVAPATVNAILNRAKKQELLHDANLAIQAVEKVTSDESLTYYGDMKVVYGTATTLPGGISYTNTGLESKLKERTGVGREYICTYEYTDEFKLKAFEFTYIDNGAATKTAAAKNSGGVVAEPVEWEITP